MMPYIDVIKAVFSGSSAFYMDKYGHAGSIIPVIDGDEVNYDKLEDCEIWWKDVVYLELTKKTKKKLETLVIGQCPIKGVSHA